MNIQNERLSVLQWETLSSLIANTIFLSDLVTSSVIMKIWIKQHQIEFDWEKAMIVVQQQQWK